MATFDDVCNAFFDGSPDLMSGGDLILEDRVLYSYSRAWVLAVIVTDETHNQLCYVNTNKRGMLGGMMLNKFIRKLGSRGLGWIDSHPIQLNSIIAAEKEFLTPFETPAEAIARLTDTVNSYTEELTRMRLSNTNLEMDKATKEQEILTMQDQLRAQAAQTIKS